MMTPQDAQKIQDRIFASMSIEQRFELVKGLWELAVELAPHKFPYASQESNRHAEEHGTDAGAT